MSNIFKAVLEEDMKMNSPQKTARIAACIFLGIFFLGMSTELFIRPGMIVQGDAATTVKNIATSEALFRLSLVSDLIPQVLSFWILLLGYLVFKSGFLPRILGILLMLGGLCYTVSAVLFFLFPNLDVTIFGLFAFIGELLFYLWLLIKGVKDQTPA
jgi:hypothetical protein